MICFNGDKASESIATDCWTGGVGVDLRLIGRRGVWFRVSTGDVM